MLFCMAIGMLTGWIPSKTDLFDEVHSFGLLFMFSVCVVTMPFLGWFAFELLSVQPRMVQRFRNRNVQSETRQHYNGWVSSPIEIIEWLRWLLAACVSYGVGLLLSGLWTDMRWSLVGAGYAFVCAEAWIGATWIVRRERRTRSHGSG